MLMHIEIQERLSLTYKFVSAAFSWIETLAEILSVCCDTVVLG